MKPEPKPTGMTCSVCALPWEKHLTGPRKKHPTLEDCVRVLRADLVARPRMMYPQGASMSNAIPIVSYAQGGGRLS